MLIFELLSFHNGKSGRKPKVWGTVHNVWTVPLFFVVANQCPDGYTYFIVLDVRKDTGHYPVEVQKRGRVT